MSTTETATRKRPYAIIAVVLIALIVIVAITVVYRTRSGPSNLDGHKRSITIAQFGDFFLYAPLYIANDAGFFGEQGLDVSIVSTGGDEKTWAAVLSGSASFGIADPTFVAISAQRGQPGKVVGSLVNGVPFWGVTFEDNVPEITSPSELRGLTVATFPSPSTAYTLQRKMFELAGLAPNIREGGFGTLLAMLKAKQADIALELEPNVSQAVKDGARVVYSLADIYGDFAITGVTTSDKVIEKDPEMVRKVTCSLQKALAFLRSDRAASLEILSKRFPEVSVQVAGEALDRVLRQNIIPRTLVVEPDAWDKAMKLRVDAGDLASVGSMRSFVDNSFASRASTQCDSTSVE